MTSVLLFIELEYEDFSVPTQGFGMVGTLLTFLLVGRVGHGLSNYSSGRQLLSDIQHAARELCVLIGYSGTGDMQDPDKLEAVHAQDVQECEAHATRHSYRSKQTSILSSSKVWIGSAALLVYVPESTQPVP